MAVLISLGVATVIGYTLSAGAGAGAEAEKFAADPVASLLAGSGLTSLVLGALGALQMSGEHSSGTIRTA